MKAIVIDEQTSERSLNVRDVPEPALDDDSVTIRVHAAGVNRADVLQRAGKYPPPPGASSILGLEVAGVVEAIGKNVSEWRAGDRVCALLAGGGYAERVAARSSCLMRIPANLTFEQAAAIPEAFLTAFINLSIEGGLAPRERVLIHGGSSGVGTAAIQIARRIGAQVACTVGSDEKASRCRELGANLAINYRVEDFERRVVEWAPEGVDVVLDMVGREYLAKNISVLGSRGRLVLIATMSGSKAEIDLAALMRKRLTIIGSVLRSRSDEEKGRLVARFSDAFLSDFSSGDLRPVLDSIYSLEDVAKAHERMTTSAHVGKIILRVA